jgi:hypothetical protein
VTQVRHDALVPPVRPRDDSQNDQQHRIRHAGNAKGSPIIDVQESHGEEADAKGEAEERGLQKLAATQHNGAAPAHQRNELVPLVVSYVPQTFVRTSNPFASKAGLLPVRRTWTATAASHPRAVSWFG